MRNYLPLISICIPTYNRCQKVYDLVTNILKYKGEEIEVVVLDNCSTDKTKTLLSKIQDNRFVFFQNEENIGAPLNQLKVLTMSKGKFAFFCLDKDRLEAESIHRLINRIQTDAGVVFGYCSLNSSRECADKIFNKGIDSILNMAYLSQHPTGIFYEVKTYKNLKLLKTIFSDRKPFPFYPDLINAEMSIRGSSQVINVPAFHTETKEECRKVRSFSYNNENAFFAPLQRLLVFRTYIESAKNLGLSRIQLRQLIVLLYSRTLMSSTFGYRKILKDQDICAHHGMATRHIPGKEIWEINLNLVSAFFTEKLILNRIEKFFVCFYFSLKLLVMMGYAARKSNG